MVSLLVAQVNLLFQVTIFLLLLAGVLFERRKNVRVHGQLMLAAAVLNVTSFLAVMGPSWSSLWAEASGRVQVVALAHGVLGGLALLLSFWLVGSWLSSPLLAQPLQTRCYSALNKKIMWAVLFLWLTSLAVGFYLFIIANAGALRIFP